ncbi:RpiR family transcriptional regulator [Terribacillus saccharophilus]|uniref:RpiR family transcriptional regulator n=4 Tax=Terribacillus saccharophilus TaxID=361277 RepID=A0A268AFW9_9BACI|nr:MurR/RpiR family transcriptional regulator [Terribacillus saccharophilus]PAD23017.1 RpiR family transcriptional regulator [Terribacillus saccharophilus]PAF18220.1 RpiR family transcriptional regulator [Terribacillus saccharophilus]PAF23711.1 RpiR family transcriptional regulator [Terribacillus saccharophilus]PAF37612.1 RpiR family transcriptional regulator [Terribacillus saccharophilus]
MGIRSHYPRLSEKEKKIADFILEHPEKIVHQTISQVADQLEVADATVSRFCKRIGYKGFQALKIALAPEIIAPNKMLHEDVNDTDEAIMVAEKIFQSNIRTLENTLQVLNKAELEQAVTLLLEARRVEFYGFGGSNMVAMDAYHKFVRSGVPAFAFPDAHLQLMSASQLTNQDVAFIFSHSGASKDAYLLLQTVKKTGAKTIAITGFPKSPIGQQVNIALHTSSEETDYRSEALASRIAQLSIIDALYVTVIMRQKEKAQTSVEKVRNAIAATKM